jgi:hypothetical protein
MKLSTGTHTDRNQPEWEIPLKITLSHPETWDESRSFDQQENRTDSTRDNLSKIIHELALEPTRHDSQVTRKDRYQVV